MNLFEALEQVPIWQTLLAMLVLVIVGDITRFATTALYNRFSPTRRR